MYILVKDNQVFAGPNIWHPKLFQSYIEQDFEIEKILPLQAPISGTNLGDDIFSYDVTIVTIPDHNQKIQRLEGPFYNFTTVAEQYFIAVDKSIDHVKSELIDIASHNRWKVENGGIDMALQGHNVTLDTSRENRSVYLHTLQSNIDNSEWKMVSDIGIIWITLSLSEVQQVLNRITNHVQSVFSWEKNKIIEINNCTDLNSLDQVILECLI